MKNITKIFKKGIDKTQNMWYHIQVNEAERSPFSPCRTASLVDKTIARLGEVRGVACCVVGSGSFARFFVVKHKNKRRCILISAAKDMQINEDIRLKAIRVVGVDGEQLGIMTSDAALRMAYDKGLDLVLMAPQAEPPVCRIMDYGKFRFEKEKREKEAKKKQQVVELKEIQLSCRIDTHDFETKARHALRFLGDGNKVRVVMRFKGREMSHMAIGQEIMDKFVAACAEKGTVDKKPVLDGRILSMVIVPLKK